MQKVSLLPVTTSKNKPQSLGRLGRNQFITESRERGFAEIVLRWQCLSDLHVSVSFDAPYSLPTISSRAQALPIVAPESEHPSAIQAFVALLTESSPVMKRRKSSSLSYCIEEGSQYSRVCNRFSDQAERKRRSETNVEPGNLEWRLSRYKRLVEHSINGPETLKSHSLRSWASRWLFRRLSLERARPVSLR